MSKSKYRLHDGTYIRVDLEAVVRHRNGVGGDGFYAVPFTSPGNGELLGIVTDSSWDADQGVHVYVVDPKDITNTLRGHDYFGRALVKAVNARNAWKYPEAPDVVTLGSI